jgi:hypothetical protein
MSTPPWERQPAVKHSHKLFAAATRLEAERVSRALDGIAKAHILVADEPRQSNSVRLVLGPLHTPAFAIHLAHRVCL